MYFVGWVTGAMITPRLSDLYGRKRVLLFSMIGLNSIYLGLILSTSINVTIALMCFLGFFSVGRASVGYLYMQELTPVKQQVIVGSLQ